MRPTLRPLIVVFSSLALASLFSYAAIAFTEPEPKQPDKRFGIGGGVEHVATSLPLSPEGKAAEAFARAKAEAAGGAPEKLMALATMHLLGIGTEPSEAEAVRLHQLGAEKGHARSQYMFGRELIMGMGVKKDPAAGLAWIRKATTQQNEEAEYYLHTAYRDGVGVKKDEATAREWLLKAAEHGQHDARVDIAEEILISNDTERYKAVVTWVRPGAMEGHPQSCHVMSFVYHAGIGVKKDLIESIAWRLVMINAEEEVDSEKYRQNYDALSPEDQAAVEKRAKELCGERNYKSAFARDPAELEAERQNYVRTKLKAEAGDLEAQFELSRLLEDGKGTKANDEEAVRWLRRSAEKGFADSQYGLALHLAHGEGVTPDPKEAYVWFLKAALQGHAYAERAVGLCLQDGEGVKADQVEGKKWILRAAEHGQPQAQWEIGCDYYGKHPDLASDAIAARWFRKSAEQLDPRALISLGICYNFGRGVTKNKIEGIAWMAIGRYDDEQKIVVDRFVDECTEEELIKVNKRAEILKKECRDKFLATVNKNVEK